MVDENNAYSFTTEATQQLRLTLDPDKGFPMWRGGRLSEVTIAYEAWGTLSPAADNAILIFTGLSPSAHAASSEADSSPGWWEYMVGPGKALDSNRFFIVCVNSLGGCYGSTGPTSINPNTGKKFGRDFPVVSVEDIATAGHMLMQELGVERLHTVVGSSMGGMASLVYSVLFPDATRHLISISAAAHALPLSIALRSLQREMIRSDPAWKQGEYAEGEEPFRGMAPARKIGLLSYRADDEWNSKFDRSLIEQNQLTGDPFEHRFEIERYLEYNANKFIHSFDPNSYQYLSQAMDMFNLPDHGGSLQAAMSRIKVSKSLVIGVTTDTLFPLRQQEEIAAAMRHAGHKVEFCRIDSVNGHDAFLIDDEHFTPVMKTFLALCND